MATAATTRRLSASERLRRSLSNGRVTAALILLPPALILFTLFVMLPLGRIRLVRVLQLERLRRADGFRRAARTSSASPGIRSFTWRSATR